MRPDDVLSLSRPESLRAAVTDVLLRRGETPPDDLRVQYVRYKPGTSCVLGLGELGYLKLFLDTDARAGVEKYGDRGKAGGWVELVEAWNAAFFRFPLDRRVVGLPHIVDPARLKHVLHVCVAGLAPDAERVRARKSRLTLLRYKPERRGIVRAALATRCERTGEKRTRTIVVQAYADDSGREVARAMRALAPSLRMPEVVGYDDPHRILVQEWCEGVPWLDSADLEPGAREAGRLALRLRQVAGAPPAAATTPFSAARTVLDDLGAFGDPMLAEGARDLGVALATAEPTALGPVWVHGDFHYHQFLLRDDGEATLLDWDEAHGGDPREDPGNLLAHLHLLELEGRLPLEAAERLRAVFVEEAGALPALDVFVAAQLARLAAVPFRNLRPRWRDATAALLERALRILQESEVRT